MKLILYWSQTVTEWFACLVQLVHILSKYSAQKSDEHISTCLLQDRFVHHWSGSWVFTDICSSSLTLQQADIATVQCCRRQVVIRWSSRVVTYSDRQLWQLRWFTSSGCLSVISLHLHLHRLSVCLSVCLSCLSHDVHLLKGRMIKPESGRLIGAWFWRCLVFDRF